jgi:hypothetical protein
MDNFLLKPTFHYSVCEALDQASINPFTFNKL